MSEVAAQWGKIGNQPEQDWWVSLPCRNRTWRLGHGTKFDGLVEVEERMKESKKGKLFKGTQEC